jgi:hypothetical protein
LSTLFPSSIDNFNNPTGNSTYEDDAGYSHAAQHSNANDAIKAVETKLGTSSSTASANTVLRGTGSGTTAFGQVQNGDIANSSITLSTKVAGEAWTSWSPTVVAGDGGGSISGVTSTAYYYQLGKIVFVRLKINFTVSGTLYNVKITNPPANLRSYPDGSCGCIFNDPSGVKGGIVIFSDSTTISFYKYDRSALSTGADYFAAGFMYEAA